MADGLAMGANGPDLVRVMTRLGQQGPDGSCKMDGDDLIHLAHAINFIGTWIAQRMQPIGDLDRPGLRMAG